MSNLEIPPFDVLTSQERPFPGFGPTGGSSQDVGGSFAEVVRQAQGRISDVFNISTERGRSLVATLDPVIRDMWSQGWNPEVGDLNLFTRDFGALLMDSLIHELDGRPVFRSNRDLSHASVFWMNAKVEAFPFHKTVKCLTTIHGESLLQFYDGIGHLLRASTA